MRTIIDITETQSERLAAWCAPRGISRSEAIRRSIDVFLKMQSEPVLPSEVFGIWRNKIEDGVQYQRRLRDEWEA